MFSPDLSASRAPSFAEILDDLAFAGDSAPSRFRSRNSGGATSTDWLFSLFGKEPPAEQAKTGFGADFFAEAQEPDSQEPAAQAAPQPETLVKETPVKEVRAKASPAKAAPAPEVRELVPPSFDLDEAKITAELGLARARSVADLAMARRSFARRNHPDLFHVRFRARANERMQLANMLLDRRRKEIERKR
jgi:hypothetical protein